jgi:hypothetical protein
MRNSTANGGDRDRQAWSQQRLRRPLLIPHTSGEIAEYLVSVEELLLALTWRDGGLSDRERDTPCPTTDVLCDRRAAQAVDAIRTAIASAERNSHVTLLAPNGRYELVPLIQPEIDHADLDLLGIVSDDMTAALGPRGDTDLAALISEVARARHSTPQQFAVQAGRLHTALTLPTTDDDGRTLIGRLRHGAARVTLTPQELACYLRLVERFLATWSLTLDGHVDPLARFLYRGGPP